MDNVTIKDVLDLGMNGVLLFFVIKLWDRLNKVTDIFINDRKAQRADSQAIANSTGARLPPAIASDNRTDADL